MPGVAVDRARDAHRGEESKTDARDARLIAELARMRRDLAALEPGELELLAELKLCSSATGATSCSTRLGPSFD